MGERDHLRTSSTNLDTRIRDVIATLESEQIEHAVLCAHSYHGMVITGVADRVPERVDALVYLDAQVPCDGESLLEHEHRTVPRAVRRDRPRRLLGPTADGPRSPCHATPAGLVPPTHQPHRSREPDRAQNVCVHVRVENSPVASVYERLRKHRAGTSRSGPAGTTS